MGKLIYLLPVWGGTVKKYAERVQVIMNNAARYVMGLGRREHRTELMKQCRWLDFKELVQYHSLVLMWKVLWRQAPLQTSNRFTVDEDHKIKTSKARLQSTEQSWRWRTTPQWNQVPGEIRDLQSLTSFKRTLKKWIVTSREQVMD